LAVELPLPTLTAQTRHGLLVSEGWEDYRLLDMGRGRKLERFGSYIVDRPEAQAMGPQHLSGDAWRSAHAIFDGDAEEGEGRWRFTQRDIPDDFPMAWEGLVFHGRFTPFRHLGLFPEQAVHWAWLAERLAHATRPIKILNLFGYTGLASLVAARSGAQVTHVDASKKAITYARENQALARLEDKPIRWIVEDAVKFAEREIRRGNRYQGIILDPPKFGRGPNGETWHLFEDLPKHLADCAALLADDADFLVLTAYAIRASFLAFHDLAQPLLSPRGGVLSSGELAMQVEGKDRLLSTSLFVRWSRT
jgi:23S rRNA (cytosine1962-C5)-methyltransferase